MTFESFSDSLKASDAPALLSVYMKALWHDKKGHWDKAHELIQEVEDVNAAWIHAYLHRKEGDIWNADYWYHRAKQERPVCSLEEEWENLCRSLLSL